MRLYKQIVEQLKTQILRGDYSLSNAEQSALPPERELAKLLNVSRTSVREAIIALEVEGWVEVKLGSGVYVKTPLPKQASPSPAPPIDPMIAPYLPDEEEMSPFSLLNARLHIEPESAALAAKNWDDFSLEGIQQAYLLNVQDNFAGSHYHLGDRLFHIRIAEASGNDAYAAILRLFLGHRYGAMFSRLQHLFTPKDMPFRSQAEHLNILIQIQKRDEEGARAAMRSHLENVINTFLENQRQHEPDKLPQANP